MWVLFMAELRTLTRPSLRSFTDAFSKAKVGGHAIMQAFIWNKLALAATRCPEPACSGDNP